VAAALAVAAALVLLVLRPRDASDRYLALGDSYAVGTGARSLHGYAPRVAGWLRRTRAVPTFLNMAVGGENTTSLLEGGQLARALDAIADDANRTRFVTLDIGANELLAPGCLRGVNVPGCAFRAGFTAIVEELAATLRDEPGRPRLLVMGLFAPFPGAGPVAARSVRYLLQGLDGRVDCRGRGPQVGMNDMIACIGRRHGATYVDTFATFRRDPRRLISPDGLHPSDRGHAAIARAFERALAR
jgi:lysophospholipase L1-like esterase